uniref:Neur_chan_memb domain-containing protein n=1 Tax=Macrostomum lignano TaxID=282301 RepID=A0A1I8IZM3_9PLAT
SHYTMNDIKITFLHCLIVNFQIYIPTILIVILSWFSFWLNIDSVPGRASSAKSSLPKVSYIKAIDVWMSVCLGFVFASLLEFAIVNVYSREESSGAAAKRQQQQLRSRNRRSGGSGGGGLLRRVGRKRGGIGGGGGGGGGSSGLRIRTDSNSPVFMRDTVLMLEEAPPPSPAQAQSAAPPMPKQRPNMPTAKKIDKFSRRFFPLSFALFNVVYWVYYLIIA